ncbi:YraN family protein [Spirochaetia bacterium 38H-sp]|uniref:UPF0102 protein WKV44_04830 n=1 Tax=Rarispira pelagica TaxID=3141764 RepID=A0ABU9UB31_9SPIR
MSTRELGNSGEDAAEVYLRSKGLKILKRNFIGSRGEVDIIAKDGDCFVFVEVKSWSAYDKDSLCLSISSGKMRRICYTALEYLYSEGLSEEDVDLRFDVIFIRHGKVEHLVGAFDGILEDGTYSKENRPQED